MKLKKLFFIDRSKGILAAGAFLAICVMLFGCRQQDIRTVTIQVPGMKNEACAELVSAAIASEITGSPNELQNRQAAKAMQLSGVIKVNLTNRTVTVQYDSLKTAIKNLEFAIADAGFDANNTPASRAALENLPAECR